jgi:hypothetical protein
MADIVFNIAKGRIAQYGDLAGGANDALILVLLKSSGLVADATMRDYDTLSDVLAGTSDEADFTGYARRTLASVTVTVDDSGDVVNIDAADPAAWTNSGGSSQAIGAALICYDNDTTGGTDANLVPMVKLDCTVTFDIGVATSVAFHASGFAYAS